MGSGALWLASIALGRDAGLALGCLWSIRAGSELYRYLSQYLSQYPRGSHASRATIITERVYRVISVSLGI